MAHTPNQVTVTVTNAEVAGDLEALAESYEEAANKLRYEADRLRQGFMLTLDVRLSQAIYSAPTPEPASEPKTTNPVDDIDDMIGQIHDATE